MNIDLTRNTFCIITNTNNWIDSCMNHNNNSCALCLDVFEEDNIPIQIINNFCKCFNSIIICKDCLIKWIHSKRCLICRVSLNATKDTLLNTFYFDNEDIYNNIKDSYDNIIPPIDVDMNTILLENIAYQERQILLCRLTYASSLFAMIGFIATGYIFMK